MAAGMAGAGRVGLGSVVGMVGWSAPGMGEVGHGRRGDVKEIIPSSRSSGRSWSRPTADAIRAHDKGHYVDKTVDKTTERGATGSDIERSGSYMPLAFAGTA